MDFGSWYKRTSPGKFSWRRRAHSPVSACCAQSTRDRRWATSQFYGSALEITASSFDLASLVNTQPSQIKLEQFEAALQQRINEQALRIYGITVRQVGLERLTLAPGTLDCDHRPNEAERETVARERSAQGQTHCRSDQIHAERDSRVLQAQAKVEAADIEAKSRIAASHHIQAGVRDRPQLYTMVAIVGVPGCSGLQ